MTLNKEILQRLPKVELHCHLDGSVRPETILDLGQSQKIDLPASNVDDLRKILQIGNNRGSLDDYLDRFPIILSVLQTPDALERVAYELIEDISKENTRYIE
ncbi:MAG: adenosine deaminase, partial [Simkaniaceae bacterium]|nr:adenosine deaminase [Simkaniaceae bacterium]